MNTENPAAHDGFATRAIHVGQDPDPATGAVSAPIHLSTTFERDVEGSYSRGFMYTRNDNPNRRALEEGLREARRKDAPSGRHGAARRRSGGAGILSLPSLPDFGRARRTANRTQQRRAIGGSSFRQLVPATFST